MATLESKPTPSGPKNSNFMSQDVRKTKSHALDASTPAGYSIPKKRVAEKKIDIVENWDPVHGGFTIHIQFIHQSLMDLAAGLEKIDVISDQLTIMENHLIKMDKCQTSLEGRLKALEDCQDSLCKGQRSIANRMLKNENIFIDKIGSSTRNWSD